MGEAGTAARCMLLAFLAIAGSALAGVPTDSSGTTHVITIEGLRYIPELLTVHRGDHVVWVNKDFFPHTVTAVGRAFDSHSIDAGGSWSYEAGQDGDYAYGCTYHPTMKGLLKVH